MVESVTAYKTEDGELFEDSAAAIKHQRGLSFAKWYAGHVLYVDEFTKETIPPGALYEWLMKYKPVVEELYQEA